MKNSYSFQEKFKFSFYAKGIASLLFILCLSNNSFSQTKGLIFEPATGGGAVVLDPNGDGYVSKTTAGFISNDKGFISPGVFGESEIPYVSFIFPGSEPFSDINNGPNGGFTDFVDSGTEDPAMSYIDGSNNWLFRLRMGSVRPNAKSYSILVDTDGLFGNTGADADPDYTLSNPGFEIEIVLATKFGVYVYDVDTSSPTCAPVISYVGNTNYQKSIAHSEIYNPVNYFLDFYVSFADLTSQFGITSSTPLRMAIVDNMAAEKSTVCNTSSASDIAGVGDCDNLASCFEEIIDNQGPCSLEDINAGLCLEKSSCPTISGSISVDATSVSGTTTEVDGTTIRVYKNGSLIGTITSTGGIWSLTGILPALLDGDIISATAQATDKAESNYDCNTKEVIDCSSVSPMPISSQIDAISGSKGYEMIIATGSLAAGTIIRLYTSDGVLIDPITLSLEAPFDQNTVIYTGDPAQDIKFKCQTGNCFGDDTYIFTYQEPNSCESAPYYDCQYSSGSATGTPTISTSPILDTTTSVSGSVSSPHNVTGVNVNIMSNGVQLGTSVTTVGGAWTINSLSLSACQDISVIAIAPGDCVSSPATASISGGTSDMPQISGTYCSTSSISTVSGISSEEDGTTINIYENGSLEGSTTVTLGAWSLTSVSISVGSTITATAINSGNCETESSASTGVVVGSQSSISNLAITTDPIIEQLTTISGTGNNGDVISLYVDDFQVDLASATVSGGVWTISGFADYEFYTGGVVTVKATAPGSCESAPSASKTVVCISPLIDRTVNPDSEIICSGSFVANIDVIASENLIVYQLYLENGTTTTGNSVLGNGSDITLTSGVLTANTTLKIKAFKIPPGSCEAFLTETVAVTVNALPNLSLNVSATTPICFGTSTNIEIESSEIGIAYQLRNDANDANIGSSVNGNGGTISLPTGNLTTDITFNILATGASPSNCNGELLSKATVLVTPIPTAPTITVVNGCGTSTLTASNYTGTLLWSNGETTESIIVSNSATYTVTQNVGGCISSLGSGATAPDPIPTAPTGLECWETATLNNTTCLWEITGTAPVNPGNVTCWDNFQLDTDPTSATYCTYVNLGTAPVNPGNVTCWDNFQLDTDPTSATYCTYVNLGTAPVNPGNVTCWDNFQLDTDPTSATYCTYVNLGTAPVNPGNVTCWDNFQLDTDPTSATYCTYVNLGTAPVNPGNVTCWDNFQLDTDPTSATYCTYVNLGTAPVNPGNVTCWDNFQLDTDPTSATYCTYVNLGTAPVNPGNVTCWDNFQLDTDPTSATYCTYVNLGTAPVNPGNVTCWDNFQLDTDPTSATYCTYVNLGTAPVNPGNVTCWDNFQLDTDPTSATYCTYVNLGTAPVNPGNVTCWDNFQLDTDPTSATYCTYVNLGTAPVNPGNVTCWDNFQLDTDPTSATYCTYVNLGTAPVNPGNVTCWDNFQLDTDPTSATYCTYVNLGIQDTEPMDLECWEITTFNDITCVWDVTISLTSDCDGDGVKDKDELNPPDGEDPTNPNDACDYVVADITVAITSDNDCDGDGVKDKDELNPPDGEDPTNPNDACDYVVADITVAITSDNDCDGDGVKDKDELNPPDGEDPTNPNDACDYVASDITVAVTSDNDCDGDGVKDKDELNPPDGEDPTNPNDACDYVVADITVAITSDNDCDGDGVKDKDELNPPDGEDPTNPNDACDYVASDITVAVTSDNDCDGDGVKDKDELNPPDGEDPTNPNDACDYVVADITLAITSENDCDGDGVKDKDELNPPDGEDPTNPNDACDYVVSDITIAVTSDNDCDGDGVKDKDELNPPDGEDPTNPNDACDYVASDITVAVTSDNDCDGDGVKDKDELNPPDGEDPTNPNDACDYVVADITVAITSDNDCDGDGVKDKDELNPPDGEDPTNPNDACDYVASDITVAVTSDNDCDGDGVKDKDELNPPDGEDPTNPNDACDYVVADITLAITSENDCDGDGVKDKDELNPPDGEDPTNPNDACDYVVSDITVAVTSDNDCDGDGVKDKDELNPPDGEDPTNPNDACDYVVSDITVAITSDNDCDGDGVKDKDELNPPDGEDPTNPNDACDYVASDITIAVTSDNDCDGDGVKDKDELNPPDGEDPTNPNDACDYVVADVTVAITSDNDCDGDGVKDKDELNPPDGEDPTNPNDACDYVASDITIAVTSDNDCDGDGVKDKDELNPPDGEDPTNPNDACDYVVSDITVAVTSENDCDGDGVKDKDELNPPDGEDPTNPNDACDYVVSDITVAVTSENDCDGDGVKDKDELNPPDGEDPTNPNDACDYLVSDITVAVTSENDCDGDGVKDKDELNPPDGEDPTNPNDACDYLVSDITVSVTSTTVCIRPDVSDDEFLIDNLDPIIIDIYENDNSIPVIGTITISNPNQGIILIDDNGTPDDLTDDVFVFQPNSDYEGVDTFTYTICDTYGNCDTATVTIIEETADLAIIKVVDNNTPIVGENVEFTIELTNNGPYDATGVNVLDLLTSGYNYISSTATAGTYDSTSGLWMVGTIENGLYEVLTITVKVNASGDYTNIAEVFSVDQRDPNSIPDNGNSSENDQDEVTTMPISLLTFPEEFTPNGDGTNDLFEIKNLEVLYPKFSMEIINRYGNKVYEYKHSGNPNQTPVWWNGFSDGRWNFDNLELPVGTYFYTIYFNNNDDRKPKIGWIYLRK